MKASDLRLKTVDELKEEAIATQREMFSLRLQKVVNSGADNAPKLYQVRNVRRKLARIKTVLNEKNREAHE